MGDKYARGTLAMAWRCSGKTALELAELLTKNKILSSDPRVQAAWGGVDRALFVPHAALSSAYQDTPLPIGHQATISAPHMHAAQLSYLAPLLTPGKRVLDIGSGTGIMVALTALMVCTPEGGGKVVGVEHIPELASWSLQNLGKVVPGLLASGQVQVHAADGRQGWAADGLYDAIHVGAAAPFLPAALLQQLALGGRMVVPVGGEEQELLVVDKRPDGSISRSTVMGVRFVPLCDRIEQEGVL